MKYEIVNLEEKVVIGKSIVTTNDNNKAMSDIGIMWNSFINEGIYSNINDKKDSKAIGLYYNYENDFTGNYSFMCCVEVNSNSDTEYETLTIPTSKYAKFTIKGHMITDVANAWSKIWNMDLNRKYTYDFEVYHNDSEDVNNQTIDIYIAIN
ncbi:MAG: GyrI-like domain-containing protein [Vallitalea sp.]|jgi:predicted transcriptional regulator YdeE|nr:GyrI-like domain-containing protein [Vallitalea sp.]